MGSGGVVVAARHGQGRPVPGPFEVGVRLGEHMAAGTDAAGADWSCRRWSVACGRRLSTIWADPASLRRDDGLRQFRCTTRVLRLVRHVSSYCFSNSLTRKHVPQEYEELLASMHSNSRIPRGGCTPNLARTRTIQYNIVPGPGLSFHRSCINIVSAEFLRSLMIIAKDAGPQWKDAGKVARRPASYHY